MSYNTNCNKSNNFNLPLNSGFNNSCAFSAFKAFAKQ